MNVILKLAWAGLKLIFWATLLYASAVIVLSLWPTSPPHHDCNPDHTVYIGDNGIHLDFIFAQEELPQNWRDSIPILQPAPFVGFGWGDEEFYINTPNWSDLTVGVAIRAALLKSPAALHLTQYPQAKDNWTELKLCEEQFLSLINYVDETFIRDPHLQVIKNSGYSSQDIFYKAHGSYNLFNTCNNWVNKGLKKAEVTTSVWSPFIYGVNHHLNR